MSHMPALTPPTLDQAVSTEGGTSTAIPKFTGTGTLGDSSITDAATRIEILTKGIYHTRDFTDGSEDHGAITSISNGVGLTAHDGGIQSFQQSTFNCTAGARQSIAIYGGNTATRASGANSLTNYAALFTASGAQQNFGIFVAAGLARFDGSQLLFTDGWGTSLQLDTTLNVGGSSTLAAATFSGAVRFNGSTIGFYNTTPQAKPTGVAVSAAGIHAALVTLGLIGA